ncbi:hypothetical protein Lser_V15G35841 [Lactuca serriola]
MDHKRVVYELTQGKEFAEELKIHLNNPSSSQETQEILIHNILNSYENSLSLLTNHVLTTNGSNDEPHLHKKGIIRKMESQVPFSESPCSEDSDPEFKDLDPNDFGAKRKRNGGIEKWKKQVKVRGEMEFEEALDDGYNWKKYGQKDILGAKHPRGYYRCTYRQLQGCLATKQVQRTNEDPNIFNMTYQGIHTCHPATATDTPPTLPLPWSSSPPPKIQHPPPQNQLLGSPKILQTDRKVITKNLETHSAHFPSTSNYNFVFPTPNSTSDGNETPSFITPTTLGSTYFMMSQPQVSMCEINENIVGVESELNDIVSAATSSTSFHNADLPLPFGELEFGSTFSFDNSIFFD